MKRHSDRKAHFERRQQNNLQWSGRVGDRDRSAAAAAATAATAGDAASQQQVGRDVDSSDPGTPSMPSPSPTGSPALQQRTVRDVVRSAASDGGPVPVGEHHQGSFGVYMAHKMDKLRHQVDGAVRRVEGMQLLSVPWLRVQEWLASAAALQQYFFRAEELHGVSTVLSPPLVLSSTVVM